MMRAPALACAMLVACAAPALAQPSRGFEVPPALAAPTFFFAEGGARDTDAARDAALLATIIAADLEHGGLVRPLTQRPLPPQTAFAAPPAFNLWRVLDAQYLLLGRLLPSDNGGVQASLRLWDLANERLVFTQSFTSAPQENPRALAHRLADALHEHWRGVPGYFTSKIAFVERRAGARNRLLVMDYDGENVRAQAVQTRLVFAPQFTPQARALVYTAEIDGVFQLVQLGLNDNKRRWFTALGMQDFAPSLAPDGKDVVLASLARWPSAGVNLFVLNLATERRRALTRGDALNVSPSHSPDGRLVFASNRSGSFQLYVLDLRTRALTRITYGRGDYMTPSWSPRGNEIAFAKREARAHAIGIIQADGTNERLLREGDGLVHPSWAPNGAALVFERQARLWQIDADGGNHRPLATPASAFEPTWSPPPAPAAEEPAAEEPAPAAEEVAP